MSANNIIYIDRKTLEVYFSGCADNPISKEDIVKKCKTLKEAVDFAQEMNKEYQVEYGINFI